MEEQGTAEDINIISDKPEGEGPNISDKQKLQILKKDYLRLRSENAKLHAKLDELDKMRAKTKLVGLLQLDRKVLVEQLEEATTTIARLVNEKDQLEQQKDEILNSEEKVREQTFKLAEFLGKPHTGTLRSTKQRRNDQAYRERFGLPAGEALVAYHHMKKGKLFLSEGYLCFDTHFSLGENKVVVPIKRIFEVVKTDELAFMGSSVVIIMYDAKRIGFRCLLSRDEFIDDLLMVALAFDHDIRVTTGSQSDS